MANHFGETLGIELILAGERINLFAGAHGDIQPQSVAGDFPEFRSRSGRVLLKGVATGQRAGASLVQGPLHGLRAGIFRLPGDGFREFRPHAWD